MYAKTLPDVWDQASLEYRIINSLDTPQLSWNFGYWGWENPVYIVDTGRFKRYTAWFVNHCLEAACPGQAVLTRNGDLIAFAEKRLIVHDQGRAGDRCHREHYVLRVYTPTGRVFSTLTGLYWRKRTYKTKV